MKHLIILFILPILIASCKKNDSNPLTPNASNTAVSDYYPLADGNYWIYEYYTADSTLKFTDQNTIDSVYVEKDTLVNVQSYRILKSSLFQSTTLVRDSSDYIVSDDGHKLFSLNPNNGNIFGQYFPEDDSSFIVSWRMMNSDSLFICPNAHYLSKYVIGIVNPANNARYKERTLFRAYAKDIGLVGQRATWLYGGTYVELRLLLYNVKL